MELFGIEKELTLEQKAAVVSILIIIAKADKEVPESEIEAIEKVAHYLEFDITHPYMQKIAIGKKAALVSILNTLSNMQKKWLFTKIYNVIMADGIAKEIEMNFAVGFAKDLGISEDELISIIQNEIFIETMKKNLKS